MGSFSVWKDSKRRCIGRPNNVNKLDESEKLFKI